MELPNLELIHNNLAKEDLSTQINNNSPSRIVKFDMPSFDSQISEDVQNTEVDLSCDQRDKVKSICDISEEMRSLLEKLQSFEMSASGDHEVLQQFTLERLKLERKKWSEILRKSLSNVVRIQNTISNAFGKDTFLLSCCLVIILKTKHIEDLQIFRSDINTGLRGRLSSYSHGLQGRGRSDRGGSSQSS